MSKFGFRFLFTILVEISVWLIQLPKTVQGHGRLIEPPSRASMWRFGFDTPKNYDDNALYCGGFDRQWNRNGGRCGVCGDPYDGPRENEAGGRYARGVISKVYRQGQTIRVSVELTRSHLGWFEFRLCPNNNPNKRVTRACLSANLLRLQDGSTRYHVRSWATKIHHITIQLPSHITCSQCVLQWKYNAGNSWGCTGRNTGCCMGCGHQEQFYGCADVAIRRSSSVNDPGSYNSIYNSNNGGRQAPARPRPVPLVDSISSNSNNNYNNINNINNDNNNQLVGYQPLNSWTNTKQGSDIINTYNNNINSNNNKNNNNYWTNSANTQSNSNSNSNQGFLNFIGW